jgi:hypothetical protein
MRRLALSAIFALVSSFAQAGEIAGDYSWPLQPGVKAADLPLTSYPTLGKSWSMVKDLVTSGAGGGVECLAKVGATQVVAGYSSIAGGVYYSADRGLTWAKSTIATTTAYAYFNNICGDGRGTVIVSAYASPGAIFRSTNYGANFSAVVTGAAYPRNVFYAGHDTWLVGAYGSAINVLYRSTDNGANWAGIGSSSAGVYGTCCGFAQGEDRIFLKSHRGFWNSFDLGETWNRLATETGGDWGTGGGLAYLGNGVLVFPRNVTPIEIRRSTDYGQTWTTVKSIAHSGGAMWATLNIGNGRVLMVGSDDGSAGAATATMYESRDYGQTWDPVYTFPEHHVYSLADMQDGSVLAGAWLSAYIYRSKGW